MDHLSKEKRSWNMSRIQSKNTTPERTVRSILHKLGYRFRLHSKTLPGKPDIVLPKYKTIIFVHGCFWHRHNNCQYAYMPKSRTKFWTKKFNDNIKRDRQLICALNAMGWRVLIIWECKLKNLQTISNYIDRKLQKSFSMANKSI